MNERRSRPRARGLGRWLVAASLTIEIAVGLAATSAAEGKEGIAAAAQRGPAQPAAEAVRATEGNLTVRDFKFANGEVLPEVRLHYLTVGVPHRNARGQIDNAVLLLHGTTGSAKSFLAPSMAEPLFGRGRPLDASKFFSILPDGIGRGGSTKPSDGLRARFPRYGYGDVVEGQHRVVRDALGVQHLRLVLGTSMGGMQAWLWAERYPEEMDAILPVASQPVAVSGRNMLWRRLIIEAIREDPEWKGGDYARTPGRFSHFMPIFNIMTDSPVRLEEEAPTRAAANALYDKWIGAHASLDANDCLYWFESSYDYDPAPGLEKIEAKVLAVNFADDALNPTELGVMEREMPRVKNGRWVVIPASPTSRGHQSLTQAAVWNKYVFEALLPR